MCRIINIADLKEDICFYNVYGLFQEWRVKEFFDYLSSPRPNHGFMYVLCDEVIVQDIEGKTQHFPYGSLLYLPQSYHYDISFENQTEKCNILLLNFSMCDLQQNELAFQEKIVCMASNGASFYTDIFMKIINAHSYRKKGNFSVMAAFYDLLEHISAAVESSNLKQNNYSTIIPAILYLDNHIDSDKSVPELAKMCLMSETKFRKIFEEYAGTSPTRYKVHAKIEKTKELLKIPELSIAAIAEKMGFYDVAYFYRVFKRETGITPLEYREEKNKF